MALQVLYSPKQVAERYGVSEKTATRYMRKMDHQEKPLRVTERALEAWENGRTYEPQQAAAPVKRRKVPRIRQNPGERFVIPRVRPE